jgi:hypothetical protein
VNTLVDEADGSIVDGDVSLRDAIAAAPSGGVIDFSVNGTLSLALGELAIEKNLEIVGPGAGLLRIDAHYASRVCSIGIDTSVKISGLTIMRGDSGANYGGGIYSESNLTLKNVRIENNRARFAGGIYQAGHSLHILGTSINNNEAHLVDGFVGGGEGGGLWVEFADEVTIDNSTFALNRALGNGNGGGLLVWDSTCNMRNSTVSGNSVDGDPSLGAGMFVFSSAGKSYTAKLSNVTIADNKIESIHGSAAGIYVMEPHGDYGTVDVTLFNCIVAGNTLNDGPSDVGGPFNTSSAHNLIGWVDGAQGLQITDSYLGGSDFGGALNPHLSALGNFGGVTLTHGLLIGSLAIDSGDPAAIAGVNNVPEFDQRGAPFARVFDGDGASGARLDIGAFELQRVPPATYGDYDESGVVDGADYVVWRNQLGSVVPAYSGADGNGDANVDQSDYLIWRMHFGSEAGVGTGGFSTADFILAAGSGTDKPPSNPLPNRHEIHLAAGLPPIMKRTIRSASLKDVATPIQNDEVIMAWLESHRKEAFKQPTMFDKLDGVSPADGECERSQEELDVLFGWLCSEPAVE